MAAKRYCGGCGVRLARKGEETDPKYGTPVQGPLTLALVVMMNGRRVARRMICASCREDTVTLEAIAKAMGGFLLPIVAAGPDCNESPSRDAKGEP
jgi:hypothetical protein